MFKKETFYINVVRQNNQLKIEHKKFINDKVIDSGNSNFLLDANVLPENVEQKLNILQRENDFSYISTILLNDAAKLVPKSVTKIDDFEVKNFNDNYNIAVAKPAFFETNNYFAKTGVDFIYSAFHIIDSFIKKNLPKNELLFFINNNRAYVVIVDKTSTIIYNEIVDLLTFETIKRSNFYDDALDRQKLYDELYYLELSELFQKILKDFYDKQKDIFIQKITILFSLKNLTKEQISTLSQELMLKIDDIVIDIDEELYSLARTSQEQQKSLITPRKKRKRRDPRYFFLVILFAILLFGAYKLYSMIDFHNIGVKLGLIEAKEELILEKLPDHVLNNSKIDLSLKAIFKSLPNNVTVNELSLKDKSLQMKALIKNEESLNLFKLALNSLYTNVETKKLNEEQKDDFEVVVAAKNPIEQQDAIYKIFTADYLQDEIFNKDNIEEQLKILFPQNAIISFIEKYDAISVDIFSYKVNLVVKSENEFFDLITKLNNELYSMAIAYPVEIKNTNLGMEIEFVIGFNQLKK